MHGNSGSFCAASDARKTTAMGIYEMNKTIDIGRHFGCWTYVRECHWGERSAVYMVAHVKDPGRVAALKICTDTDEESVRAFRREISNTRLRLLPGRMPEVLDEGERDGMPYYVMTFGEDVDVECKSEKTAVSVALFLIECCIELRKLGYVHGDLKPENIGENLSIRRFTRYQLGEGIEKKEEDFAAEVAAQLAKK